MNTVDYGNEALRQLNDHKYYSKIDTPIQPVTAIKIRNRLIDLYNDDYIDFQQLQFLSPPAEPRPRRFYLLPKIHKDPSAWPSPNMPPGRPIVSNVNSESSAVSKYIDSFLNPLANKHPSYIKNSFDLVKKIRGLELEESEFLVTADITSLYTNMDNQLTLDAVAKQFSLYPDQKRPDLAILDLLKLLLESNDFSFGEGIFLQKMGCSMGLSCSPSLANIFLIDFDQKAMEGFKIKPRIFFRYLDDCFFTFKGNLLELSQYKEYLNSLVPNINLTFTHSHTTADFLDTTIFKCESEGTFHLQTKVFFKTTDSHALLHHSSFHPRHIFGAIVFSQLLRFRRLSSFREDYNETCNILLPYLTERGYSASSFRRMRRKVWFELFPEQRKDHDIDREKLVPIVMNFGPPGTTLVQTYKKTIKSYPMGENLSIVGAFCNAPSLSKILVSSKS